MISQIIYNIVTRYLIHENGNSKSYNLLMETLERRSPLKSLQNPRHVWQLTSLSTFYLSHINKK